MSAMTPPPAPIVLEKKTVAAMVAIYCHDHHDQRNGLCAECQALLSYSHGRLDRCPYGGEKPVCRECPIHCYRPTERAAMRGVMRHAGPKMLLRHPWLALLHLWKERVRRRPQRKSPTRPRSDAAERIEASR